jgi:hypothetical protein
MSDMSNAKWRQMNGPEAIVLGLLSWRESRRRQGRGAAVSRRDSGFALVAKSRDGVGETD